MLDTKNLTPENRIMALSSLDRLVESFQIEKDRLIIEGQSWKALEVFTQVVIILRFMYLTMIRMI